jgi:hypothetical protein
MKPEILELIKKQPRMNAINCNDIREMMEFSNIREELHQFKVGRDEDVYLVQMDNNLLAVFKSRKTSGEQGRQNEVMSFHLAHNLMKLPHTVPPTVEKVYKGMRGILQFYVHPDIKLGKEPNVVIKNIDRDSYADLQVFKFIACVQDGNDEGIIAWKNSEQKFCLTHVDNELLLSSCEEYGETIFGKTDITNFVVPKDAFISRYTSFFNPNTIHNLQNITEESVIKLYKEKDYEAEDCYVKRFVKNCTDVVNVYQQMIKSVEIEKEEQKIEYLGFSL